MIHLLVKNPNDLNVAIVLAEENHVHPKGARATTNEQFVPGTASLAIRVLANLVQRFLDQFIVALELKLPPFLNCIFKDIFNILGCWYGKLVRQWIKLYFERQVRFFECLPSFLH